MLELLAASKASPISLGQEELSACGAASWARAHL